MENALRTPYASVCMLLLFVLHEQTLQAQCNNADFENGTLSGWLGTYGNGTCTGTMVNGQCNGCYTPDPYQHNTFNQGPDDQPANGPAGYNHFIMSGGFDPIAGGNNMPVVYTPGDYSMRLGDAHANDAGHGGGESIKYRFTVTPANCNFIYHYAVVLKDGGHSTGQQPYFKIGMTDGAGNTIDCATYDVDATTAQTIGGFTTVGNISYKSWSTVAIPLNAYIGQTVSITFTTRDCAPNGCEGQHFAYAYIDAECSSLDITASSPTICNGQNITLTAPDGAASYAWSGPGIISGANTQQCVVNMPGNYSVDMTTFGTVPCNFTLSTVIPVDPNSLVANFSAAPLCAGVPASFTDLSTPTGSATTWAWDFNNDGTTDATTQNPTRTFATAGTYPVHLHIGSPPCMADTTINVVVAPLPTANFTVTSPVCAGANAAVNYTGTAPAGATYSWNFSGGTIVSGAGQGPYQLNWLSAGTKNITLTVNNNGCISNPISLPITVNPIPVVTVSPNTAICAGTNTILTANGANSYNWTPAATLNNATNASVTATPISTTTYHVTGTSLGCVDSASVTVTINPLPIVTVSPNTAICAGTNTILTANGANTYNWSPSSSLNNSTSASVTATPTSTTTYHVTGTSLGCVDSASVTVTVNPLPVVTVSPNTAICAGTNTILTANGANTYNWSPAATLNNATNASVTATPTSTTTYHVTGTSLGCDDSASVTVTVNPLPVVTVSPNTAICAGANTALTATGASSYNWSPAATLNNATNASVTATPTSTTTYHVTGTSLGCVDSASVTVTVNPLPVVTVSPNTAICAGANTILVASGANTYNWSPAATLNNATNASVTATPTSTTTYHVTGTSLGCVDSASVTVTVNPLPFVTVSPNTAICAGANTILTATGASSYNWSPATTLNNATNASVTATPTSTTTYHVTGTSLGCVDSASVTVTINPLPIVTVSPSTAICAGANTILSANGANSYNWSPSATLSNATSASVTATPTSTTTYHVTGTSLGCVDSASVTVTVNPLPVVTVSPNTAICAGANTILTANGANTYNWSPAATLNNATNASVTATPISTTTYHVTGTSLGCVDSASVTVSVTPLPVATFNPVSGQCLEANSFHFNAGGTYQSSASFHWNFGSDAFPSSSSLQNPVVFFSSAGNHPVSLSITQNACAGNVFSDTVTVYPMPVASLAADTSLGCENMQVCFADQSTGNAPFTYQWNFGDGMGSTEQNPCHTFASAGDYTIGLQVTSAEGCKDDVVMPDMIRIIANPIADFSLSSPVIQLPATSVSVDNNSQNAVSYWWILGEMGTSASANPGAIHFTEPGYYPVTLYAYNLLGCVDSFQQPLTVYQEEVVYVPNVFTPNGDGNNDFFEIFGKKDGWKQIEVMVFDRWGEKLFESNDHNFKWDGTYRGTAVMPGVFVYVLNVVYTNNHTDNVRKGSITLLR